MGAGPGGGAGGSVGEDSPVGGVTGTGGTAGAGGSTDTGGGSGSTTGTGGTGAGGGTVTCTPGVKSALVTDCGYPVTAGSPLSSVIFYESAVLRAIQPEGGAPMGIVRAFYNNEHALILGVRRVVAKSASGMTTTDYPVTRMSSNPGSVVDPQIGTDQLVGPQSGLDQALRPMWPALFITDITDDLNSRAGDWQYGGRPLGPNAIFGTWRAAIRTVDATMAPNKITITPDPEPMKNNWNLGTGDQPPTGLPNQGFGAEVRWQVSLESGHSYRIQVMVHDGELNKVGSYSGQACLLFCAGGTGGGAGGVGGAPPPMCPSDSMACGNASGCTSGTVCANGCCIPLVP